MSGPVLRVGTRGSALAMAQAGAVAAELAGALGVAFELVRVRTEGDTNPGALAQIGGTGVFVTGVRAALLAGTVDVIVHSLKDLPTAPADGVALGAVPPRADPADALCARDGLGLDDLPPGATVGTGSPRRAAQLRRHRTDLQIVAIRGNVDTRLGRVTAGDLDAVVLAAAGLARLSRAGAITELLSDEVMLPAPAQGALAVECRIADYGSAWFAAALADLDSAAARAEVTAERSLLRALEAGCSAPLGARARLIDDQLVLTAVVVAPDGTPAFLDRTTGSVDAASEVGARSAGRLLAAGAATALGGTHIAGAGLPVAAPR